MDVQPRHLPLPSGMKIPAHQVTGHFFGNSKLGLLECEDGTIAKPCESPKRGVRERKFYQSVFSSDIDDPTLLQLRQIVPKFLGIFSVQEHPNVPYMRLENLIHDIFHPCVMDIKMGAKSYDPEASQEKIKRESEKSPYQMHMGFRLAGMRVYQTEKMDYVVSEKFKLRAITPREFLTHSLTHFLSAAKKMLPCVVMSILRKLLKIRHWFMKQKTYEFYSSSIFFVYEGDILRHPAEVCTHCTGTMESCLAILKKHDISAHYLAKSSINREIHSINLQQSIASGSKIDRTGLTANISEAQERTFQTEKQNNKSINKDSPSSEKDNYHLKNGYLSSSVPQLPQNCFDEVIEYLNGDKQSCNTCDKFTNVRMIDFAHVFETVEMDEHYLHGLNNLINYFIIFLVHISTEGRQSY